MSKHTLPLLPYTTDALEPYCDEATLKIHHGKHHQAYVDHLNEALQGHPDLQAKSLEDLLTNLDDLPSAIRSQIINNAGGHFNHTLFWNIMGPEKGGKPTGKIGDALLSAFGSFESFKTHWKDNALKVFGSGWTFLVMTKDGKVEIQNYVNQECPISKGLTPLLLLDVWEHAYYLKFQNRRAEWIDAWWNVVNWNAVNALITEGATHALSLP